MNQKKQLHLTLTFISFKSFVLNLYILTFKTIIMKLKLLLLLLMVAGMLKAQEPYRQLLITEAIVYDWDDTYFEFSNMGDEAINLKEFKFAVLYPGTLPPDSVSYWTPQSSFMLPDFILEPGKSFVICPAYDFGPEQFALTPPGAGANERPFRFDMYDVADLLVHFPEVYGYPGDVTDSVDLVRYRSVKLWGGNAGIYLEHHFVEGDSAVVDQFNAINDGKSWGGRDVAGVTNATRRGPIIRKFKIKTGNLNFDDARGVGADDSEWIALPYSSQDTWRKTWWIVGNHGNNVLDANTLESDVIGVDFPNKELTVPWGISRLDGIMQNMKKKPGVAWTYILNANKADSLFRSVRTGDRLAIMVCGDELTTDTFDIVVSDPTASTNIVAIIDHQAPDDGTIKPITGNAQRGNIAWPRVSTNANGVDTISGSNHGLPSELRTDSLLAYLEKPENASWEFISVDGVSRPDLKKGDILKVTSSNGTAKEYYLNVQDYAPNQDAFLSAITWPDIPGNLSGYFGWKGDTIPNFSSGNLNYTVKIPIDVNGIPAMVAKTVALNAKIAVTRAVSLKGSKKDRTISFDVTAEDGITTKTYNVELIKEKDFDKLQPYFAEPFMAEFIMDEFSSTSHMEIYNPGNQPIDLSKYMFTKAYTSDPNAQIASTMDPGATDWGRRFRKYVPGYVWGDEAEWSVSPGILVPDLNVNPILQPGELFVMTANSNRGNIDEILSYTSEEPDYDAGYIGWPAYWATDIFFFNHDIPELSSPWGELAPTDRYTGGNDRTNTVVGKSLDRAWFMFKIKSDSVLNSDKPANDPNDFELIEAFGMADGTNWSVTGKSMSQQWMTVIRKPEIYKPNPVLQGSFADNDEDSEWIFKDQAYWSNTKSSPYPRMQGRRNVVNDLGLHYMIEPTQYKSTVTSMFYKVSDGYSMNEDITGVVTSTSVGTFLSNLAKADEAQTLTVKSVTDGTVLADDALVSLNDTLVVLSADSTNTSKYILNVAEFGLSSNTLLTSSKYVITVEGQPKSAGEDSEAGAGTVTGFDYGTSLKTIVDNITVPPGASMDIIDGNGAYVTFTTQNFDKAYVDVAVNSDMYFYVLAEDGLTSMVYKLIPQTSANNAFLLSDVYSVVQKDFLVKFVPRGTTTQTFLSNVVASEGATMQVVDKTGLERVDGALKEDDKVIVTSPNGLVQVVYHLSMLAERYIPETTYLAYVLSIPYIVDQIDYTIVGPTAQNLLTEFYSNLIPSQGASVVVVDKDGVERTTGDLNDGDKLKVTSVGGKVVVIYDILLDLTSVDNTGEGKIQLYPNPTSGKVNIQGLEQGTRVQVYNHIGALIRDINAERSIETITLENQAAGMYLVVITKNAKLLGQYKVIRK